MVVESDELSLGTIRRGGGCLDKAFSTRHGPSGKHTREFKNIAVAFVVSAGLLHKERQEDSSNGFVLLGGGYQQFGQQPTTAKTRRRAAACSHIFRREFCCKMGWRGRSLDVYAKL